MYLTGCLLALILSLVQDLTFKTSAGKAVYKAIFEPQQSHSKDFFAPRRTAFVYATAEDSSSMPTIWRRPRAECPTVEESIMGNLDANCLQDIAKIMAYLRPTVTGVVMCFSGAYFHTQRIDKYREVAYP